MENALNLDTVKLAENKKEIVILDQTLLPNECKYLSISKAGDIWEAQAAYAFNLGPEDVVLIISNSGSSKRLETLALGAKENGSTLVLITNNRESPLAQICDSHRGILVFQSHSHYCDRDHLPSFDGGKEGCG